MNKQETVEEAATRVLYSKYHYHSPQDSGYFESMFIEGAKWKEEQVSHENTNLKRAIALLRQTTEYEVVESFREKVDGLEYHQY